LDGDNCLCLIQAPAQRGNLRVGFGQFGLQRIDGCPFRAAPPRLQGDNVPAARCRRQSVSAEE
jgi:hypothetical protein